MRASIALAACSALGILGSLELAQDSDREILRPPALEKGSTIMFVAPAGDVDRDRVKKGRKALEAMGYRVAERKDLYDRWGYLAGTDERRAKELMQAFKDDRVDAIFCCKGGFGSTRILDLLDYDVIRDNPKILLGFSDITSLHLAIQKHAGVVTFHGPGVMSSVGSRSGMTETTQRYLFGALTGDAHRKRKGKAYAIEGPNDDPIDSYGKGRARGRLVGGNLSLVSATMGTRYEIDTDDRVLFLEDVREPAYKVDRMLTQLKQAGKLDRVRGVVLGKFTRTKDRDNPRSQPAEFSVPGVLRRFLEPLKVPVLTNFPSGHHRLNATLPIGAEVEVDAKRKRLVVLEPPVIMSKKQRR